jgi:hypothetical protein
VSAGYSISRQDSDTSTFSTVYSPYYTPENILTNTLIAAVAVRPSPKATLRFHGGYGFAAREDAPMLLPSPGNVGLVTFARREFKPWDAHVAYETALSSGASVTLAAQSMKTAFYRATSGSVSFTYRFRQGTPH